MKLASKSMVRNFATALLAVLAILAANSPSANARHRAPQPAPQPAAVIAHLALPGASVSQLVLRQRGSSEYLYIAQDSREGFAVVDVTKPNLPSIVKREAWPNEASTGRFQMIGSGLALTEAPDTAATDSLPRTQTLRVLDLSDPANPRTILTFSGVTSALADDARNLLYITNGDGLWIVTHPPQQTIPPATRGCLSEDASNEVTSCQ
jgi:hypothetical protein